MVADPRIRTDTATYGLDISTQSLRKVGHFVHKADFGSQHRVRCILGQLGGPQIHKNHTVVVPVKRIVDFPQHISCAIAVSPHDNTIRLHEVGYRSAFFQKLGVGRHIKFQLQATAIQFCTYRRFYLVSSADRYGRFVDHNLVAVHVLTDRAGDSRDILQIGGAIFVRGGAHRDKLDISVLDRHLGIGRELEATGIDVMGNDGFQPRFINRNDTAGQFLDFYRVNIHAQHIVPYICQTGACNQPYVPGSKNGDLHLLVLS